LGCQPRGLAGRKRTEKREPTPEKSRDEELGGSHGGECGSKGKKGGAEGGKPVPSIEDRNWETSNTKE